MPGLRIGIDVGGTFTHGVVLRPPGEVIAKAVTPTTHTDARGVAAGVAEVLRLLLAELETQGTASSEIELVAHSTTQATNALLEGDVSGVHLMALAPPGEHAAIRRALGARLLDVGNGHSIRIWPKLLHDWDTATPENFPALPGGGAAVLRPPSPNEYQERALHSSAPTEEPLASVPEPTDWRKPGWDGLNVPPGFTVSAQLPVAIVQPLAGQQELREETVAAHYRACGHGAVCASEITQVLGLQARTRTAIVNAAMLPEMLATADYTEQAVHELLPSVPIQVVRGDGGAMSLAELRRQPVHSLLSGPAAGASAALHCSGLANAVFIEVGGTSTDITLIQDGRVRHRYATVGGQRLLVPALDLRTVAVGGGSMLRADTALFGPRSAHIAGLPYLFQALQSGLTVAGAERWVDPGSGTPYVVVKMSDGSLAAFTVSDFHLTMALPPGFANLARTYGIDFDQQPLGLFKKAYRLVGELMQVPISRKRIQETKNFAKQMRAKEDKSQSNSADNQREPEYQPDVRSMRVIKAYSETCDLVAASIKELAESHGTALQECRLIAGGGGAPAVFLIVGSRSGTRGKAEVIPDHAVISAIGAALAVTCVSVSKSVASPTGQDIATLTQEVETRLAAQGAERVGTDYEFDPQRQVLTVTGRGSRPYEQDAQARSTAELDGIALAQLGTDAKLAWESDSLRLWTTDFANVIHKKSTSWFSDFFDSSTQARPGLALDRQGRVLWQGRMKQLFPIEPGQREAVLAKVLERCTQYTDGGPALPGLALLCAGRFIPLDLGDAALIAEVLRWERLPDSAAGCFIVRA